MRAREAEGGGYSAERAWGGKPSRRSSAEMKASESDAGAWKCELQANGIAMEGSRSSTWIPRKKGVLGSLPRIPSSTRHPPIVGGDTAQGGAANGGDIQENSTQNGSPTRDPADVVACLRLRTFHPTIPPRPENRTTRPILHARARTRHTNGRSPSPLALASARGWIDRGGTLSPLRERPAPASASPPSSRENPAFVTFLGFCLRG